MEKRVRSPNYPAISLTEAIGRIESIYREINRHAGPREVIAKAMGFGGLNGASATVISALHKYGLLDRDGDEVRVSDRALRILHPHSDSERSAAVVEAGRAPSLFAELAEKFPGRVTNQDLLKNYLIRRGFAPSALDAVVAAYLETSEIVARESESSAVGQLRGGEHIATVSAASHPGPIPQERVVLSSAVQQAGTTGERSMGRYDFEGGAYVRIVAGGEIDTLDALDMVETLVQLKRRELERARAVRRLSVETSAVSTESEVNNE